MRSRSLATVFLLCLSLVFSIPAAAQAILGSITGTVKDATRRGRSRRGSDGGKHRHESKSDGAFRQQRIVSDSESAGRNVQGDVQKGRI